MLTLSIARVSAKIRDWAFATQQIREVMGFPAGSLLDQNVRLLTDQLQQPLGARNVQIVHRPVQVAHDSPEQRTRFSGFMARQIRLRSFSNHRPPK